MRCAFVGKLLQVFEPVLCLNYRLVAGVLDREEVDYLRIRNKVVTYKGHEIIFRTNFDDVG